MTAPATLESIRPGGPSLFARKAAAWLQEMRLPFLVVTVLPVIFGVVVARSVHIPFDLLAFVLSLAGASFVHIGANVINDYFDYHNGTDAGNTEYVRGFTGGSRALQDGLLSYNEVLAGALLFLVAGAACVLYLARISGQGFIVMGAVALFAAVTYSVFLHALVVGELVVGLCFGTLIAAGSFYAQAGFVSAGVVIASLPMGLLVFLILFINEIPDYTADKDSGKNTIVVRLGRKQAARMYCIVLASVYLDFILMAVACERPLLLGTLLTAPAAAFAMARVLRRYDTPAQLRPAIIATIALFAANSLALIVAFALRGR